jgi:fatty-acyl-CoA synthase
MSLTLSYAHGADLAPLLGITIGEALRETCGRYHDREALVVPHQGYRATYGELWDEVERVMKGLISLGVEPGDRVAIWAPNRYEWVLTQLATGRMGAILVNINPAYKARELEYALRQSGARVLFLSRSFRGTDYPSLLREVLGTSGPLPKLRVPLVIDDSWESLLDQGRRVSARTVAAFEEGLSFDDPINLQYTSGTTGAPKAATLTHHNILNNGYFVARRLGYTEEDRICIPVPFYHCFGMVLGNLAAITHGACMVIPGESFNAGVVLRTVQTERCTSLYGVPTMFIAMLEHPLLDQIDLASLRTGIMSGAPCPEDVLAKVRARLHMPEVAVCYGMTETAPVSVQTLPDDPPERRVTTVGKVQSHVEIKIVRSNGMICPRGEVGELCTRGYGVMAGYWDDPVSTEEAIDRQGWMHSGDLARMDEAGYVSIEGRRKDMIIRGGENIYPRELEDFLMTHPLVAEAQVVGVPSEKYGEEVMAWIRPREGQTAPGEGDLAAFCRGRIATYKIPRYWRLVESYPLTVTGKVQKFRLREMGLASLDPKSAGN